MIEISSVDIGTIFSLTKRITDETKDCSTLAEAAQTTTSLLYETFAGSIALARLFVTVPFGKLPLENRRFVNHLAENKGIIAEIGDETPVLSLLGTRGKMPNWNDRRLSAGHIGIPLTSSAFINEIPMIANLLQNMGVNLTSFDHQDMHLVTKTIITSAIFYVEDAAKTVDKQGRKIIAAQDFVDEHGIKTVFGLGGTYTMADVFLTLIIFCRETVEKSRAERLVSVLAAVKANSLSLVSRDAFF